MTTRHITAGIIATALLTGCHNLDFDETNGLNTRENIYRYFDDTKQMLTNVYSYMPQDFGAVEEAMRSCASDDAEFGNAAAGIQDFNNGNWSAIRTHDTAWSLYKGIRAANEFIESIAKTDFSRFKYDQNYPNWEKQLRYFPYEARALRAFYLFELARRYGDIAVPLKMLSIEEANTIGKTPFHEVISFIVSECDECCADGNLPDTYRGEPGNETGRMTRGAVMALKAKALLYDASPLHNPEGDKERWLKAAAAAHDIIESGLYSLDKADKCNNVSSPEIILMRMNGPSNSFEQHQFPIRFTDGRGTGTFGSFPTQNLVDAFQTRNGYDVTLTPGGWECDDPAFNPARPYANRDPRFERTILANGSLFKGDVIETFDGGRDDAVRTAGGTPTGYFLRKYLRENTSFNANNPVSDRHHWIVFRYAGILLAYAEAMMGAHNDAAYSDATLTHSAEWALNQVRTNAGMPTVEAAGAEAFTEAIRREWRVEFAFEDHRFWDIRRWKIAQRTQCAIYGVRITRQGQTDTYRRKNVETRIWNNRMYLFPIPQSELFINRNLAPQNPGW